MFPYAIERHSETISLIQINLHENHISERDASNREIVSSSLEAKYCISTRPCVTQGLNAAGKEIARSWYWGLSVYAYAEKI